MIAIRCDTRCNPLFLPNLNANNSQWLKILLLLQQAMRTKNYYLILHGDIDAWYRLGYSIYHTKTFF